MVEVFIIPCYNYLDKSELTELKAKVASCSQGNKMGNEKNQENRKSFRCLFFPVRR